MYLTTPIYYANDAPHIGHAYTTIAADAVARYHRLRGQHAFLLTGTDEHGINIERIAARRGVSPNDHVEEIAASFVDLWERLDIRYDRFVRTSQEGHKQTALDLWQRLRATGDLYRGIYEGAYCSRCEAYYQTDELDDGNCPVHHLPCDQLQEENWFFRLSSYQDRLERLVRDTDFVQPSIRRNEVLGVLSQGVQDFSASRRQVKWGIPVPESPGEVLYVWVDALASYLDGDTWPAAVHLVGKEIIRFHCLYWPALLWSAGLPLPKQVFAHGWLTKDGQKISKTTGNTIDPGALAEQFGSDAVRYYFLRAVPFGQDGDFSQRVFVSLYNADLANAFGNLVQRASTLAARHGTLPGRVDSHLQEQAAVLATRYQIAFESLALHEALAAVNNFVREANRYLELTAPWKESDAIRRSEVLANAVEAARLAAWYYAPVIPRTATEAHCRLSGTPPVEEGGVFEPSSHDVVVGSALFPRLTQ